MLLPQKKIKKLRLLRALDLILSIFLKTERGAPKRTMEMTVVPAPTTSSSQPPVPLAVTRDPMPSTNTSTLKHNKNVGGRREGEREESKMAMQQKPVSSGSPNSLCRELPTGIRI